MRCPTCEWQKSINDGLRDRCGTLELINEGLQERAVTLLNVDPNTDLNGRVAVLQLDRAVRRIAELESHLDEARSEILELQERLNPQWPTCPQCGGAVSITVHIQTVESETGYRQGGHGDESWECECGSRGDVGELAA